jgi:hypothetical protein
MGYGYHSTLHDTQDRLCIAFNVCLCARRESRVCSYVLCCLFCSVVLFLFEHAKGPGVNPMRRSGSLGVGAGRDSYATARR